MDLTKRWLEAMEGTNALACDLEFQDRKLRRRVDAPDARNVHFEFADPVRKFASWPGKRNYEGKFWFSSTKQHVPFESFWERAYLATLDRPGTATAVASQPMWIRWPAHERSHAPDYFARLADGSGLLVDVKPRELTKEKDHVVFDLTRRLAGAMGWTYQVFDEMPGAFESNLRFLLRYRDPQWLEGIDLTPLRVGDAMTIADAAAHLASGAASGLGATYALIWLGHLDVDLSRPLSLRAPVEVGVGVAS